MTLLIVGLVLFLGTHSVRIWGEPLRTAARARLGENAWKGLYSLLALAGFGAIVWGYGQARETPTILFMLPTWSRHLAALLVLVALVLMVAAYTPKSRIRAAVHHPMTLGTGLWALGHLLANGTVADVAMFGGFLAWAAVLYPVALRRDAKLGTKRPVDRGWGTDAFVVALGVTAWAMLAFGVHAKLFGVSPFLG